MNDMTETQQLALSQALRVADIHPSPTNPRKTFPEEAHAEMVKTVLRHGVMQPILVRPWPEKYEVEGAQPKYELIAGERRYRAAKSAGLEFIPGTVRDLDDHETIELQIVENLHRKDLNELEEAEGYELAMKQFGYAAEQLAEKIEKSKAYIYARLKLTAACEVARQAFRAATIDASRLLLIARIPTARLQEQALEEITDEGFRGPMNYRTAAKHVQDKYMLKLAEAPFPRGDAELLPAAGKCHPCPKRTGNNPELYPDVKSADICTDPECFAAKKAAHFGRIKTEAKAQGKAVIDGNAAEKLLRNGEWNIAGFHKLDDKCYEADFRNEGGYPTYRELLADKGVPVTLIQKSDGALIEAVDEKAFKEIAADVGAKTKEASRDHDKERLAKEKAENEFRRRLFDQVRGAYAEAFTETGDVLDQEDIRLIARQFLSCLWHEYQKRLAMLWVPSEEKIDAHERIRTMTAMLDTMTRSELNRFLIDLALIGMSHVSGYGQTETPAPFLATAQRMLISPDTIRRELKAEQDAKAKGKGGKQAKAEAPVAAGEAKQAATAEVQPKTDCTEKEAIRPFVPEVGDRVRIREDVEGVEGLKGKEGYITQIEKDVVIINLEPYGSDFRFTREEFDVVPEPPPAAESESAQPSAAEVQPETANAERQTYQVGDRVRYADEGTPEADAIATVQAIHENGNIEILSHSGKHKLIGAWAADRWMNPAPLEAEQAPAEEPKPAARKTTAKVEILYSHPENADLAWTGRGRKPKWVEHWLKTGTLEQLLAKKRPKHKPKTSKAIATSAACEISTPRCDKTLELPGVTVTDSQPSA